MNLSGSAATIASRSPWEADAHHRLVARERDEDDLANAELDLSRTTTS